MAGIIINKNNCKACYLCIDVCPKKCIKKSSETDSTGNYIVEFAESETSKCIGCKSCAIVCPDYAITEVYK